MLFAVSLRCRTGANSYPFWCIFMIFRKVLYCLASLGWAVAAPGLLSAQGTQGTITGRVTEVGTNQPVPSAQVMVLGSPAAALTNAEGQFTIRGVLAGAVTVRTLRIGYAESRQQATVLAARAFVDACRELGFTPHVARNQHRRHFSAIDGRTTRHAGYQVSQRIRKRIEETFGWIKTVGNLRKTRHRGVAKVDWYFTLALSAYNLVRMRNLGVAST